MKTLLFASLACSVPLIEGHTRAAVTVEPSPSEALATSFGSDPRTPIDATTTPGDADSQFRITQSGSYYLRGNISGVAGKSAIEIAATDVSIDLMGFSLVGVPGSLDGIRANGSLVGIHVSGGTVRNFGEEGLDLRNAFGIRVRDVAARFCGGSGMFLGDECIIESSQASTNEFEGIRAGRDVTVTGCVMTGNGREGLELDTRSTVSDCVATDNGQIGIDVGSGAVVIHCSAGLNSREGFFVGDMSVVRDCTASDNGRAGFLLLGGIMRGCNSERNVRHGFELPGAVLLRDCLATRNETSGFGEIADGSRLDGNHAYLNGNRGFTTDSTRVVAVRNSSSAHETEFSLFGGFVGAPQTFESQTSAWSNIIE